MTDRAYDRDREQMAYADHMADQCDRQFRDELLPAAKQQARDELIAEVAQPGSAARIEWQTYCREHQLVSAKAFVEENESIDGELFTERVDAILESFREGMEANA